MIPLATARPIVGSDRLAFARTRSRGAWNTDTLVAADVFVSVYLEEEHSREYKIHSHSDLLMQSSNLVRVHLLTRLQLTCSQLKTMARLRERC